MKKVSMICYNNNFNLYLILFILLLISSCKSKRNWALQRNDYLFTQKIDTIYREMNELAINKSGNIEIYLDSFISQIQSLPVFDRRVSPFFFIVQLDKKDTTEVSINATNSYIELDTVLAKNRLGNYSGVLTYKGVQFLIIYQNWESENSTQITNSRENLFYFTGNRINFKYCLFLSKDLNRILHNLHTWWFIKTYFVKSQVLFFKSSYYFE
ncbi:MAG TPA: hypothetical protein PLU17_08530 [Chitinophagaceae bacterium]|nr:hypothetical protein [Chitinophagaceae bacterium]